MSEDSTLDSQFQDDPGSINIDYIKSNLFRVITVDGASATLAPQPGKRFLSLFTERYPIPRQVVYEVLPDRSVGKEVDKVSRDGLVREVEIGVVIDIRLAKGLRDTLSQIIEFSNLNNPITKDSNQQ